MRIRASHLVAALVVVAPVAFTDATAQATGQLKAAEYVQSTGAAKAGSGCDTGGLLAADASGYGTVVCDPTTQQWIIDGDSPEATIASLQSKYGVADSKAEAPQQYTVAIYHANKLLGTTTLSVSPGMPAYASVGTERTYAAQCVKTTLGGTPNVKLIPGMVTSGLVVYGAFDMHDPIHPLHIRATVSDLHSMKTVESGDGCAIEQPDRTVDNREFPAVALKPGARIDVTDGNFRAELTRVY